MHWISDKITGAVDAMQALMVREGSTRFDFAIFLAIFFLIFIGFVMFEHKRK
jgi:hypothetical protein